MPQPPDKKESEVFDTDADAENCPERQSETERVGLPETDSILEEKQFRSPTGKKYRILRTNETDEYEQTEEAQNDKRDDK